MYLKVPQVRPLMYLNCICIVFVFEGLSSLSSFMPLILQQCLAAAAATGQCRTGALASRSNKNTNPSMDKYNANTITNTSMYCNSTLLLVNTALVPLLPAQSFPQSHHQHQHDDDDDDDDDNCDQAYNKKYFQVDPLAAGDSNVDIEVIKFVANMARVCPSVH